VDNPRDVIRPKLRATADEIRRLKRWLRTRPEARPERPETQFALAGLKQRATLLCMIIAHSRGRIHRRQATSVDEQYAELIAALDAMEPMKYQTPLLDAELRAAARAILARKAPPVATRPDACVAPTAERRA
jgi:hypothetical protein